MVTTSTRHIRRALALTLAVLVGAGLLLVLTRGHSMARATHQTAAAPLPAPPSAAPHPVRRVTARPAQRLVAWHGPVPAIFFHPVVIDPRLAFTDDATGRGFQDYFVTAHELQGILDGLYRNGWTLVDTQRAAAGTVRVPPGRKPLLLSEDDVNYYAYFTGRGLAARLRLDPHGNVRAEVHDATGTHLSAQDLVPMVDAEVAEHPDFSADGAKGLLAVTGYEGLLGEHAMTDPAARARVRALASRLRATGWTFASHTYGHINLSRDSAAVLARDTARWRAVTGGLLGPVHVLVYPFGARPRAAGRAQLRDLGFPLQLDIDVRARLLRTDGVTLISRLHVDGFAFAAPARMAPFFSVATVRDPARPPAPAVGAVAGGG